MIRDVHYSAVIDRRLSPFVLSGDFNGLFSLLDSFSHSQFRTAVYMLGEKYIKGCKSFFSSDVESTHQENGTGPCCDI